MNHSLGKTILILLFTCIMYAEDFTYTPHIETHNPYVKEPVLLSIDLKQTNPNKVLLFQFSVNPNKAYKIHQIKGIIDNTLHHKKHHYLYELYPLKSGDINITFSFIKRVTTDAKVRFFASGDRDDFKKLQTKDFPIALKSIELHVKPLPKNIEFIGDYKLDYKIKTHQAEAFVPIPMTITITGKGYPPVVKNIIAKNEHFKQFTENPEIHNVPTPTGTQYTVNYITALSAGKNFTLPNTKLKAFNPKTQKEYFLEIPEQNFTIKTVNTGSLVDKTDTPKPFKIDLSNLSKFFGYLITFIAGYFTAILWKREGTNSLIEVNPLKEKIISCNDAKSLLRVLMAADSKKFALIIEALEDGLYKEGSLNLKKLKTQAMEIL